jgi:hypothetical protein
MPAKVALMNRALRVFAGETIVAPDDGTDSARACSQAWNDVLDAVLAEYPWSHACRWERAALAADREPFGFAYVYRLPEAALRLVDVRGSGDLSMPPAEHALVGDCVYTDAHPAWLRYVFRNENTARWPEPFREAFCMRLAAEVAPYLGRDAALGVRLRQAYLEVLDAARRSDALQQNLPHEKPEYKSDFIKSRRGECGTLS